MSPGCSSSGPEKAGGDLPAQSLQDAPGQREDYKRLCEAILALRGCHGVLGTFSFTPNGDGLHEVSIVQIEQGKPKLLKSVRVDAKKSPSSFFIREIEVKSVRDRSRDAERGARNAPDPAGEGPTSGAGEAMSWAFIQPELASLS